MGVEGVEVITTYAIEPQLGGYDVIITITALGDSPRVVRKSAWFPTLADAKAATANAHANLERMVAEFNNDG